MKKNTIILIVIIIIAIIAIGGYFVHTKLSLQKVQTPVADKTADWNTLNNDEFAFSIKYPNDFFDAGHDPKILVGDCNYDVFPGKCPNIVNEVVEGSPSGSSTEAIISNWGNRGGKEMAINNTTYCYYNIGDAAMMHQYYYDYYATVKNQKCIVVQLDSVSVSCDVYLPLEPGNTEQAKNYNDCLTKNAERPKILNEIINTFKFIK